MSRSWLLALSVVLAGCGEPHVLLQAARRDAPLGERQKSYQHLRPAATAQTVIVNQADGSVTAGRASLILANGQTVHHPEDMIPVVSADSPTAEAGRRHQHHDRWDSVGWTLSTAGVLLALGSIAIPVIDELDKANPSPDIWWTGVIGGAVAVVVGSSISYYHGARARDAKVAAFATYDASLRAELNLCVAGTRLVDCGEVAGSQPPPGARADCTRPGAFRLQLRYEGSCAGPTRLTIRHDPTQARHVDLAAGSFDPKREALDTVSFAPEGCHAELVHRGPAGELRFTIDGEAKGRVAGQGILLGAGGASCPVRVNGSYEAR